MNSQSLSGTVVILSLFAFQPSVSGQNRYQTDDRTKGVYRTCVTAMKSDGDKSGLSMCSEAERRLRPYAEKGDAAAQASLGFVLAILHESFGVPTDAVEAYSWVLIAANELEFDDVELMRAWIQSFLTQQQEIQALVLARERDLIATKASEISEVPSREFEPFEKCLAASEKEDELSPETIAICEVAMRWYFPEAAKGHVMSQCFLGAALIGMGKGAEGSQWVKHAALQGLPEGQFLYATLLQNGIGVPEDLLEARKWASLAGDGAQALRNQIKAQLKERQGLESRLPSKIPKPSLDGVYIGLWESTRFFVSGTVRMVVETQYGEPHIEVFVTGGSFKGGKVELTSLEHAAGGLWKAAFKAKKLEVSGTFHGKTFVGSYKYRRRLKRDDVGQWMLFKE